MKLQEVFRTYSGSSQLEHWGGGGGGGKAIL